MDWDTIETAPRDGRPVLLFVIYHQHPPEWVTARWEKTSADHGDWELIQSGAYAEDSSVSGEPTHWAALPLGPNGEIWRLPDPPPLPTFGPPTAFEAMMQARFARCVQSTAAALLRSDNAFLTGAQWSAGDQSKISIPIRLPKDFHSEDT